MLPLSSPLPDAMRDGISWCMPPADSIALTMQVHMHGTAYGPALATVQPPPVVVALVLTVGTCLAVTLLVVLRCRVARGPVTIAVS